jgi:hypothetical protein
MWPGSVVDGPSNVLKRAFRRASDRRTDRGRRIIDRSDISQLLPNGTLDTLRSAPNECPHLPFSLG